MKKIAYSLFLAGFFVLFAIQYLIAQEPDIDPVLTPVLETFSWGFTIVSSVAFMILTEIFKKIPRPQWLNTQFVATVTGLLLSAVYTFILHKPVIQSLGIIGIGTLIYLIIKGIQKNTPPGQQEATEAVEDL